MTAKKYMIILVSLLLIGMVSGCIDTKKVDNNIILTVRGTNGTQLQYNFNNLTKQSSLIGFSAYQDSDGNWGGHGYYRGITLSLFAEKTGGMQKTDILLVKTHDNNTPQIFTYENIYPPSDQWNETQGTIILAYEFNGTKFPDWKDGLRVAFLPNDNKFSNEDNKKTASLESQTAAESRCIKHVSSLEFKNEDHLTLGVFGENKSFSWSQILRLPSIQGIAGFKKSTGTIEGPFTYTGLNLTFLFSALFNINQNFAIDVFSSDGYRITLTSKQVLGDVPIYDEFGIQIGHGSKENLSLVLGYYENNALITSVGPFRLMFLGKDGLIPFTDGHFWAKFVSFINITEGLQDFKITLEGLTSAVIGRDVFDSITFCPSAATTHHSSYSYLDGVGRNITYEGFPLYIAISIIDGNNDEHYHYNEELALGGYEVLVKSSSGQNLSLSASQIKQNTNLFLAYKKNGIDLPQTEFPVRLIWKELSEKDWIGQIESISLINITPIDLNWSLSLVDLNGSITTLNASEFLFISGCTLHHTTILIGNETFAGLPLYVLISIIDGGDTNLHYFTFNEALALSGYIIQLTTLNNTKFNITSQKMAYNKSIIIAYLHNGHLFGSEGPFAFRASGLIALNQVIEIKMMYS